MVSWESCSCASQAVSFLQSAGAPPSLTVNYRKFLPDSDLNIRIQNSKNQLIFSLIMSAHDLNTFAATTSYYDIEK